MRTLTRAAHMLGQLATDTKRDGVGERWCWREAVLEVEVRSSGLKETRNSRGGDYGGGVHCVVRGAKCYLGYSMGYDCTFPKGYSRGYDYTFSKGGGEGRGVIYEYTYVPGKVGYAFG